jgi:hypothetical protein
MGHATELPKINELGFYEMHFESVGGPGANLAGQILAQTLLLAHWGGEQHAIYESLLH